MVEEEGKAEAAMEGEADSAAAEEVTSVTGALYQWRKVRKLMSRWRPLVGEETE